MSKWKIAYCQGGNTYELPLEWPDAPSLEAAARWIRTGMSDTGPTLEETPEKPSPTADWLREQKGIEITSITEA